EYGRERLARAATAAQDLSAREMISRIHKDVLDWTEGQGATDDITFFIIKAL
ncbi:MAG: SpoIIE family protein phosphatase, partial [Pyrinomonadaceae bacterium]|nr:SpoIIE family protein phosphatase [Pyrinomonadaceae bacterium]